MPRIERAIISVSDKTGLVEFASELSKTFGVEIASTGGTAHALCEAGIRVAAIESYTGFPEMMDGRLKTLHPKVHGAILGRPQDFGVMGEYGIVRADLVVVNLYPFEAAVRSGCTDEEAIEQIDIGGPAMLRSAAKNHERVTAVMDPLHYDTVLQDMRLNGGRTTPELRRELAAHVFCKTSRYDAQIAERLKQPHGVPSRLPVRPCRESILEL